MSLVVKKSKEAENDGEQYGDTTEDGDGLHVRDFVPAMTTICDKLEQANDKVVRCLCLLKEFSMENFGQVIKCGRRPQQNDQLVELAIEHQIYDTVDAKGTEGAIFMEVWETWC